MKKKTIWILLTGVQVGPQKAGHSGCVRHGSVCDRCAPAEDRAKIAIRCGFFRSSSLLACLDAGLALCLFSVRQSDPNCKFPLKPVVRGSCFSTNIHTRATTSRHPYSPAWLDG